MKLRRGEGNWAEFWRGDGQQDAGGEVEGRAAVARTGMAGRAKAVPREVRQG